MAEHLEKHCGKSAFKMFNRTL